MLTVVSPSSVDAPALLYARGVGRSVGPRIEAGPLGASEGELLGSVARDVVRKAVCDVLVVQTSALDEDRLFAATPATAAADRAAGATRVDPGGAAQAP